MTSPVARFVLPLDACKPQNRTNHRQPWAYVQDRKRIAGIMGTQARKQAAPLPGRPRVVCTRFSSVEPDAFSDWAKMAVDVLTLPTARAPNRLGFLRDDRPKDAEIVQRWEYAPPKQGRCEIEVWADESASEKLDHLTSQNCARGVETSEPVDVGASPAHDTTLARKESGIE